MAGEIAPEALARWREPTPDPTECRNYPRGLGWELCNWNPRFRGGQTMATPQGKLLCSRHYKEMIFFFRREEVDFRVY